MPWTSGWVLFAIALAYTSSPKTLSTAPKKTTQNQKKRKNLLIIDHCVDVVGGVERIICTLSNHFVKKYNVTVLSENKFTNQSFFTYDSKVNKYYLIDRTRDPFHGKGGRNKISYLLEKFANRISRIGEKERLVNFLEENPEVDVIIFGRIFTALRFCQQ